MAVGLTGACAEFFAQYVPLSYRTLVFILGGFSMVVSNLGLSQLIQISGPVLTAIYPPCIALVVLSFTRSWWHNSSLCDCSADVYQPAFWYSLLDQSICIQRYLTVLGAAFTAGRTRSGVVNANSGDGGSGHYLGSRGRLSGDLQRSLNH